MGIFYDEILINPNISTIKSKNIAITSQPYELCICESNVNYSCSKVTTIATYRGRTFTISVLALAQGNTISSANVRAKLSKTAQLKSDQILQALPQNCTEMSYTFYSSQEQEQLILYLDEGSCRDIGAARKILNVTFLPCPDAFELSGDRCVCEERLQAYGAECNILDDRIYITRKRESQFWMTPSYTNGSYKGMILYPTCPLGYCKDKSVNISLLWPDDLCDDNRTGMLCGACATSYSLMLGTSKCQACSNNYLLLLFVFLTSGIALVVFLTLLKLTVATGTINCVILYANILQANKSLLFPSSVTNTSVLSIFISWLNLDFGFHTCFYHGLNAYAKTWLQFVFPVYVWFLILLIIRTSRSFICVTKLLGSNPIAVLATLILMSYAKILKIIIAVYSSVELQYPGNVTKTVWLVDANVPYLHSWHLVLAVTTTLVLIFLFLPYTLLLLFGYKLYGRMPRCLLIKIRPLLDSYYAPYTAHTLFWPGFLLLVRCILYTVFSYESTGHTNWSRFTIIVVFAAIISLFSIKIYEHFHHTAIEIVVYLNLIVLAAVTSNGANNLVVNCLIGMVLAITVGIICCQFYVLYISKRKWWLKLFRVVRRNDSDEVSERSPLIPTQQPVELASPSIPTRSVVSIHEQV